MKFFLTVLMLNIAAIIFAQPPYELSKNIYRIPYDNGTVMKVSRDHFTHTSPDGDVTGRYDLVGTGQGSGCTTYRLVAAAAGIVRRVVDTHNTFPPGCDPNCADYNNYVWIEHANGEWTKYTHMKQYSASQDAGIAVNDTVCAGTFLGYECNIGQADGQHLHFEVRRPLTANINISVNGGFMNRNDADHLVPVFNSFSKHYLEDNDTWTASGSNACTNTNITVPAFTMTDSTFRIYMASGDINTSSNQVIYSNGSDGMFHAGNSITLSPGFRAAAGSFFHARIGNCSTTPFPGGCH